MKQTKAKTIEIRWHGRGGQGAVTSAELVALAAIHEGKFAQAMPSFGPERRGAPVLAFTRIDDINPIRVRASITEPDIAVILDSGLLGIIDVTAGLKKGGTLIINSPKSIDDLQSQFGGPWHLAVVNGSAIAKEMLGVPIVNTTMIGALIKATNIIDLKSLNEPLSERFGIKAKNNLNAAQKAYDEVIIRDAVSEIPVNKSSFKSEVLPGWKDILPGCVVIKPGSASEYRTGDWRSQRPVYDYGKCIKCGFCYIYCPEGCIAPKDNGFFNANLYYCKGCGLCAKECPKKAITMTEEI